ncbi:MAG: tetratricopeptide repeat protein [Rikenellaceae bacterium]|jgi:hypothetical protein|nr:tetratricopeptide repeat protein [Rikenellaceae bacterium]
MTAKTIFAIPLLALLCVAADRPHLERRADAAFIRGDHGRAMELYDMALQRLSRDSANCARLEVKTARLHALLQREADAILHYGRAYRMADAMLTPEDVCRYADNLRLAGDPLSAERIVRHYAFRTTYCDDRRLTNLLGSFSERQRYRDRGQDEYVVELIDEKAPRSELYDPLKIYAHIHDAPAPRELSAGQPSVSPDGSIMVATAIAGNHQDRIRSAEEIRSLYPTRIVVSYRDKHREGWGMATTLFDDRSGCSDAWPSLFDAGRSMIFSSDRPGGYGGMDLYVSRWDERLGRWGEPRNLGSGVNTGGDEICPLVVEGKLWFSSNGHEGFGGYDIYSVAFADGSPVYGAVVHCPYPINTPANDFGLIVVRGNHRFISDRRGAKGRDDVYTLRALSTSLSRAIADTTTNLQP